MREKFEAWFDRVYPSVSIPELRAEIREAKWPAWQAAYAAGMQRAAEICDSMGNSKTLRVEDCADAIRAEIGSR